MALDDKIRRIEHLTGHLAMDNDDGVFYKNIIPSTTISNESEPKLHSTTTAALTSLRDSNDALSRKLRLAHSALSSSNCKDDSVEYWNCFDPPMITIHEITGALTKLNLGGSMIRIKTMESFLTRLSDYQNTNAATKSMTDKVVSLKVLNLGGTDVPTSSLSISLRQCPLVASSLCELYLGGNGIAHHRDGINSLVEILTCCPKLITLDLRYNDLSGDDDGAWSALAKAISGSKIEVLHLEGNGLGCRGTVVLGEVLLLSSGIGGCRMRELYLGDNGIGIEGAGALTGCMRGNSENGGVRISKLYLEGNKIRDAGVDVFSEVLEGAACRGEVEVEARDGVVLLPLSPAQN